MCKFNSSYASLKSNEPEMTESESNASQGSKVGEPIQAQQTQNANKKVDRDFVTESERFDKRSDGLYIDIPGRSNANHALI